MDREIQKLEAHVLDLLSENQESLENSFQFGEKSAHVIYVRV